MSYHRGKGKPGSGKKKSCSANERNVVLKAATKNPKITCSQLLLRMPKTLGHLSRSTLNTTLKEELKRKSFVAAIKPFLTESQRERKLAFVLGLRYWGNSLWKRYLYADETNFHTKNETSGRRVRREEGSSRFDPRYTVTEYKQPEKLMAWYGIVADGQRVLHFLGPNETLTSVRYASTLHCINIATWCIEAYEEATAAPLP